jgi:aliphatic nitrilase
MAAARIVRAAAAQLAPDLDRPGGTLAKVQATIAEAAGRGCQLVVFPETFIPSYPYFSFIEPPVLIGRKHLALYEGAITVPGPETAQLAAAAREHRIVAVVGVNERDHGTLYNTQLVFDADGALQLKRRKITPTYHERMIWGQGDASGLKVVETAIGRLGALACWEHYNPLARFALMAQHEEIHASQFPGSMVGQVFADQIAAAIRHHAAEAGCFVINATGWLTAAQKAAIDPGGTMAKALSGGCYSAIVSPEGALLAEPLTEGEGLVIADLDLALTVKRKRMMDCVGHYARPELLSLALDDRPKPVAQGWATGPAPPTTARDPSHDQRERADAPGDPDQRAAGPRAQAG